MTGTNNDQPSTKGDLAALRTELKTDIKNLDQKIDSVKTELSQKINTVAIELAKTQADVREIKHNMATKMSTKDDISRVLSAIDAFAAEAIAYRNHDTLRGRAIMDQAGKLENHETRLATLESK